MTSGNALLLRLRGRGGSPPPPTPINDSMGANTLASTGGISTAATAISAQVNNVGTPITYYGLAGGLITPTSAGVAAGLANGPHVLTLDNGAVLTISIIPNAFSVRGATEFAFRFSSGQIATTKGNSVYLREGTFDPGVTGMSGSPMRRGDYRNVDGSNSVVIRSHYTGSYAQLATFSTTIQQTFQGVAFYDLAFTEFADSKFAINADQVSFPVGHIDIQRVYMPAPARPIADTPENTLLYGPSGPGGGGTAVWQNAVAIGISGPNISSITIRDNYAPYCLRLIACGTNDPGGIAITGNRIGPYWAIAIIVAANPSRTSVPVTITDNEIFLPVGRNTDGPESGISTHPDPLLITGAANMTENWTGITVSRNTSGRGARGQTGPFAFRDMTAGSGRYFGVVAQDNRAAGSDGGIIFHLESGVDCTITGNRMVGDNNPADPAINNMVIANVSSSGSHTVSNNISEGLSVGGTWSGSGNIQLGKPGEVGSTPFTDVLVGPTFNPTTPEGVRACLELV